MTLKQDESLERAFALLLEHVHRRRNALGLLLRVGGTCTTGEWICVVCQKCGTKFPAEDTSREGRYTLRLCLVGTQGMA